MSIHWFSLFLFLSLSLSLSLFSLSVESFRGWISVAVLTARSKHTRGGSHSGERPLHGIIRGRANTQRWMSVRCVNIQCIRGRGWGKVSRRGTRRHTFPQPRSQAQLHLRIHDVSTVYQAVSDQGVRCILMEERQWDKTSEREWWQIVPERELCTYKIPQLYLTLLITLE